MIVADTNVVSELMRQEPSPVVATWIENRHPDLYTTSITVAEIYYGIERLPKGKRRELIAAKAIDIFTRFGEQVLPFDEAAAAHCGKLLAYRERAGLPITGFDAQIAAICREHNAALATRNGKDFMSTGISLVNPWED